MKLVQLFSWLDVLDGDVIYVIHVLLNPGWPNTRAVIILRVQYLRAADSKKKKKDHFLLSCILT